MEHIKIEGMTPEGEDIDIDVELLEGSVTINGHSRFVCSEPAVAGVEDNESDRHMDAITRHHQS